MGDPAVDLFIQDARRQGLSVRAYARRYGITLDSAQRDGREHEVSLDAMAENEAGDAYSDGPLFRDGGIDGVPANVRRRPHHRGRRRSSESSAYRSATKAHRGAVKRVLRMSGFSNFCAPRATDAS